jgi:hypothetical protein
MARSNIGCIPALIMIAGALYCMISLGTRVIGWLKMGQMPIASTNADLLLSENLPIPHSSWVVPEQIFEWVLRFPGDMTIGLLLIAGGWIGLSLAEAWERNTSN